MILPSDNSSFIKNLHINDNAALRVSFNMGFKYITSPISRCFKSVISTLGGAYWLRAGAWLSCVTPYGSGWP
jgi:hypothetical protein